MQKKNQLQLLRRGMVTQIAGVGKQTLFHNFDVRNLANLLIGSLSHNLRGVVIHPRWCRIAGFLPLALLQTFDGFLPACSLGMKSDLDKAYFKFDLPMERRGTRGLERLWVLGVLGSPRLQKVEVGVVTDHDLTEAWYSRGL